MQSPLKIGVIGAGFWSRFQIPAWQELTGVEIRAVCDKNLAKAQGIAEYFNIPRAYEDAETMLEKEPLDVVDIISNVETHPTFIKMAALHGQAVITQKPLANDLKKAAHLVDFCQQAKVPFFVHENFRWQKPIRRLKELMDSGKIGTPFKANVTYCNSFPVFENQPFLAELEQFILTDIGTHILDIDRFLFGEVDRLYCQIKTVNPKIKGEDVAHVMMRMKSGLDCYTEMSYASIRENERFPQTFVLVEGDRGSIRLGPDFQITTTTKQGTVSETVAIPQYDWADPDYALIHSSIVDTHKDILAGIRGEKTAETTGEDNLKTLSLVFDCYRSAEKNAILFN